MTAPVYCDCKHYTHVEDGRCTECGKPAKSKAATYAAHTSHVGFVWECRTCRWDWLRARQMEPAPAEAEKG